MTKLAINLLFEAHKVQKDKSGLPYIFHPFHVAEQMDDEDSTIVALLHDLLEDTSYTVEDLKKIGFNNKVCDAIILMTHDDNVTYLDYVKKIKNNEIARKVKIADLKHNSDLSRLDIITEYDLERKAKYAKALEILLND
jgi:(p)ppGpp synthase/HD superfamily hydrolase